MPAARPSSTSSNPGSIVVPPGATRARISVTASTASVSASTDSSSHFPDRPGDRGRRSLRGSRPDGGRGSNLWLLAAHSLEEAAFADDLAGRLRVRLERLALGARDVMRDLDIDDDVQVAALAGPAQVWDALAPEP